MVHTSKEVTTEQKNAAIAGLFIRNMELEKTISQLTGDIEQQRAHITTLERLLRDDFVSKEWIVDFVKESFKRGRLPLPEKVLKSGLPVSVVCESKRIFFRDRFEVDVTVVFSVGVNNYPVSFTLDLIPKGESKDCFPDFHFGYEKPATLKRKTQDKES